MKIVGSIDIPVTETTWGTWGYDITEEDLKAENCRTFGEFMAKVRAGEIRLSEYDPNDFEVCDSELTSMSPEYAEGFDHGSARYIKSYEDPCDEERP